MVLGNAAPHTWHDVAYTAGIGGSCDGSCPFERMLEATIDVDPSYGLHDDRLTSNNGLLR